MKTLPVVHPAGFYNVSQKKCFGSKSRYVLIKPATFLEYLEAIKFGQTFFEISSNKRYIQ